MATLLELCVAGSVIALDPELDPSEQVWRRIYLLPRMATVISEALPTWQSHWQVEDSPVQQFDALVELFCGGQTLTFDRRFKPLTHIRDGIWQLKTPDLRFFGWFPMKDCFVGGALDTAFRVKTGMYTGYVNEVAYHMGRLALDEPKFVPGPDPNDVVTDYDYPD